MISITRPGLRMVYDSDKLPIPDILIQAIEDELKSQQWFNRPWDDAKRADYLAALQRQ